MNYAPHHPLALKGVELDEKTASMFVNRAITAVSHEISQDTRLMETLKRGASLGNPIGRARLVARARRNLDTCTLDFDSLEWADKSGCIEHAFIEADEGTLKIRVVRILCARRKEFQPYGFDLVTFKHHALVRAVQRADVRSVDDVLSFIRTIWFGGLRRAAMMLHYLKATSPGTLKWLVPLHGREGVVICGMLARETDDDPFALVTFMPEEWNDWERASAAIDAACKAFDDGDKERALAEMERTLQ